MFVCLFFSFNIMQNYRITSTHLICRLLRFLFFWTLYPCCLWSARVMASVLPSNPLIQGLREPRRGDACSFRCEGVPHALFSVDVPRSHLGPQTVQSVRAKGAWEAYPSLLLPHPFCSLCVRVWASCKSPPMPLPGLQWAKPVANFPLVYGLLPGLRSLSYLEKQFWFNVPAVPTSQDKEHFVDLIDRRYSWIILDTGFWLAFVKRPLCPTVSRAWPPLISTVTSGGNKILILLYRWQMKLRKIT